MLPLTLASRPTSPPCSRSTGSSPSATDLATTRADHGRVRPRAARRGRRRPAGRDLGPQHRQDRQAARHHRRAGHRHGRSEVDRGERGPGGGRAGARAPPRRRCWPCSCCRSRLVVRDQVLVTHAAREGAREAAVDDDPRPSWPPSAAGDRAPDPTASTWTCPARGEPGSPWCVVGDLPVAHRPAPGRTSRSATSTSAAERPPCGSSGDARRGGRRMSRDVAVRPGWPAGGRRRPPCRGAR